MSAQPHVGPRKFHIWDTSVKPECFKGELNCWHGADADGKMQPAEIHAQRRARQRLGHDNFRLVEVKESLFQRAVDKIAELFSDT